MNTIGIIVCVALPAFALGVSTAAWTIRSRFGECFTCGAFGHHDHSMCDDCATTIPATLDSIQGHVDRITDVHLAR